MSTETDGGGELVEGAIRAVTTVALQGAQMLAQRRQWLAHLAARETEASTAASYISGAGPVAGFSGDPVNPREREGLPSNQNSAPTASEQDQSGGKEHNLPPGPTAAEATWLNRMRDNAMARNAEVDPAVLFPGLAQQQAHKFYAELVDSGHHVGFQLAYNHALTNYEKLRSAGNTPFRSAADLQAEARDAFGRGEDLHTFSAAEQHASQQSIRVAQIRRHLAQLDGADALLSGLADVSDNLIRTVENGSLVAGIDQQIRNLEEKATSFHGYKPAATSATPQSDRAAAIASSDLTALTKESALIHDLTFGVDAAAAVTGPNWPAVRAKGSPYITAAHGSRNRRAVSRWERPKNMSACVRHGDPRST